MKPINVHINNLRIATLSIICCILAACASVGEQGTIAELSSVDLDLKDAHIDGGLDKAMQSYQKFLQQTPDSAMTPEAIRRLADLKIEKDFGVISEHEEQDAPTISTKAKSIVAKKPKSKKPSKSGNDKADKEFEKSATASQGIDGKETNPNDVVPKGEAGADLQNASAEEAIALYKKLLKKYPLYERNDQVLYQLSRAYEEIGKVEEAMGVMNRLVKQFPNSRYNDEVHFRRGEYYFTRKKYLDAEEAYGLVLKMGVGTVYYERALYKGGWTFYKQELYEEALQQFISLLDYKVSVGYDFEQVSNKIEKKRVTDTFRVISLSFSNLGGSNAIKDYFKKYGSRAYEDGVYRHLAEFYFAKRRYSDAASTYNAFIEANPFHKVAPHFSMRVIEVYFKGGFPRLVIEAKKQFASKYGIKAEYWNYFNQDEYPKVLGYLKTNLVDLANHYHALYQNKRFKKKKRDNFSEASHWYKQFLQSFPKDKQSPEINYQLADLYLENRNFDLAAVEYERTAYDYPENKKSRKAAYAAIYSHREYLKIAPAAKLGVVKREIVRSSLRLVDAFPDHEKATLVLAAATDDLFLMRDFPLAVKVGRRLIKEYPKADKKVRRGAWLVVAHSSFDLSNYIEAEEGYIEVLKLTGSKAKDREKLVDNLAASIYKQGELAKAKEEYKEAVRHFLRIANVAPQSKIRQSAEYDASAVLIQIKDYEQASTVLLAFRKNFPQHELQKDVTKKIAFVFKELKRYALAAKEFERVAAESDDIELLREAWLIAADMYEKIKDSDNALRIYQKYVIKFPKPIEFALETHNKIALIYKAKQDIGNYHKTLKTIITTDASSGDERTARTKYLAANASLTLTQPEFEEFVLVKLTHPLKHSMKKKQKLMKRLVSTFARLVDYEVADVTAASTYYIAEIYYNFSKALMQAEKPKGLSELESEEFTLAVEDQAFPFEEKAISVHEKNVELLTIGVYSNWIDKSIEKLSKLLPARYGKQEESTGIIADIKLFRYVSQKPKKVLKSVVPTAENASNSASEGTISSAPSQTGNGTDTEASALEKAGQPASVEPPGEDARDTIPEVKASTGAPPNQTGAVEKPSMEEQLTGSMESATEQAEVEPSITDDSPAADGRQTTGEVELTTGGSTPQEEEEPVPTAGTGETTREAATVTDGQAVNESKGSLVTEGASTADE